MGQGSFVRLALLVVVAAAFVGLSPRAAHAQRVEPVRPNIIHIIADDLGWKDVGYNGATDIKTPNLDKLASSGAVLTQFYVQPMCTPSRAAIMTGRYPFRYGLQTAVIPSVSTYGLNTDEWLMPQCLKEAGYETAIIGKWHLGHADKKFWPRQRGFDYQYGPMIGELDYYTRTDHGVLDWFRNNEPVKEDGYTTTLLGSDAVKYIEGREASKPFYLYLTFNAPHTPFQAPQEAIDRYKAIEDPTRRTYAAMISCLDDEIGRVLAALDQKKLRENTLIIFHSDNGGTRNAMFSGVIADVSKIKLPADNGPYREGKGMLFEGGVRVSAIMNWPGHIKAGKVDALVHCADFYPTFAALAGASMNKCKQPMDGVNVWDAVAQGTPSPRTELVYNIEPFRGAIREGNWKLIWRTNLPSSVDLYDLSKDPSETTNLADAHPERVATMQKRLNELAKQAAKPLFLLDQWKVVQTNLKGEPVMPTDEEYGAAEGP